jgi:hypothetical protein
LTSEFLYNSIGNSPPFESTLSLNFVATSLLIPFLENKQTHQHLKLRPICNCNIRRISSMCENEVLMQFSATSGYKLVPAMACFSKLLHLQ